MKSKILVFFMIMILVASCGKNQSEKPGMDGQIREYPVMEIQLKSTTLFKYYPAALKGQQTVDIRSKIAGYIEQIFVDEGATVHKGQLLFRLNNNDLQATVRSAEAQVKMAEADVHSSQLIVEKTKPLVEKNIVSKFELESANSVLIAKEAQLAQARANLENARASLQYALITSPTDGTIGNFPYRVGSLVSISSAEPLTTVSNMVNMHAYFSLNEKDFLTLTKGLSGKTLQEKFTKIADVTLILADKTEYPHKGKIETASGLIDQQTGAVTLRASFENPEGLLRSGGSGLVRISQKVDSAIIIPQKATYELQGKHFLFRVDTSNIIHETEVEVLAGDMKDSYVVTSGLSIGDRIVVEGLVTLRNETEIKPKLISSKNSPVNSQGADQAKNKKD